MALQPPQTRTPIHLASHPQKAALVSEFAGKPLRELRTPALVIDRHIFAENCARMHANAAGYGAAFRAHLKSHKVTIASCKFFIQLGQSFCLLPHHVFFSPTRLWKEQSSSLFLLSRLRMPLPYLQQWKHGKWSDRNSFPTALSKTYAKTIRNGCPG
jgi:hypothetical protein